MENGNGTSHPSISKYKRRRVSAVRDFPPGCGRHAPRINLKANEDVVNVGSVENLVVEDTNIGLVVGDCMKASGTKVDSQSLIVSPSVGLKELLKETTDLKPTNVKPRDQADVPKLMKMDPVEGFCDGSNNLAFQKPLEDVNCETHESSKASEQADATTIVEKLVPPSKLNFCSTLHQTFDIPNGNDFEKLGSKKYPPRRRVSAIRDFPPFCGRNASSLSKQENHKSTLLKRKNLDLEKSSVENKIVEKAVKTDMEQMEDVNDRCASGNKLDGIVSNIEEDGFQVHSEGHLSVKVMKDDEFATSSEMEKKDHDREKVIKDPNKKDFLEENKQFGKAMMTDMEQPGDDVKDMNSSNSELRGIISRLDGYGDKVNSEGHLDITVSKSDGLSTSSGMKGVQNRKKEKITKSHHKNDSIKLEAYKNTINSQGDKTAKVQKKCLTYKKDKSLGKKLSYQSDTSTELQEDHIDSSQLPPDMVIVQALMAAPYCPWRNGKGAETYNAASLPSERKRKKQNVIQLGKSKPASMKKKDASKVFGEFVKTTSSSITENAADQGSGQLVVWNPEDASQGNEENDNFRLAPRSRGITVIPPPFGTSRSSGKYDVHDETVTRNKVRETLRLFQVVSRKILQGEESKSKVHGQGTKRIDLQAAKILKDKGKYINTGKPVLGCVPGIEVGDEFHYRVELSIIGLHRLLQGGIDYVKEGGKIIAVSVVASGGYADDLENSDFLVYTGSGGNVIGGDKVPEDQKLERGNLALKNSIEAKNPVRVIRGFKVTKTSDSLEAKAKTGFTYTYDGLYLVEKLWQEVGPHGKLLYKYLLGRIPGQPELAWKEVKNSDKFKVRDGLCVYDISDGKEPIPISAINTIDDEKPPPFNYITRVIYPDRCHPLPLNSCGCTKGCSDSDKCSCAVQNGGEIPYNYNGAIVEAKPMVYECSSSCKCPPSCPNRVSQHGIKFQLEIFKTKSRGWGVRSLTSIPSGSFICEYIGKLLEDTEAERRTGNDEYLFDIGKNSSSSTLWDGLSTLMPNAKAITCDVVENVGFTIDAVEYGNVGRFINHSCSPNLYAQDVLFDHGDKRIPHIMLFAAENIPPLQELTYHYNYTIDEILDSMGNIKKKSCYCSSSECTGRMY